LTKQGHYHGLGCLFFASGEVYEGLFWQGKRHGRGTLYAAAARKQSFGKTVRGDVAVSRMLNKLIVAKALSRATINYLTADVAEPEQQQQQQEAKQQEAKDEEQEEDDDDDDGEERAGGGVFKLEVDRSNIIYRGEFFEDAIGPEEKIANGQSYVGYMFQRIGKFIFGSGHI